MRITTDSDYLLSEESEPGPASPNPFERGDIMEDNPYTAVIMGAFRALFESPFAPLFILLFVLYVIACYSAARKDPEVMFFD
jgi:hypothetical protein